MTTPKVKKEIKNSQKSTNGWGKKEKQRAKRNLKEKFLLAFAMTWDDVRIE